VLEEATEKLEEEWKEEERKEVKEIAESILEKDIVEDCEMFNWICGVLAGYRDDFESA